mgnify:CR=1 FL=1
MDVDLAFYTNTTHSWGIHGNGINTTQTEEEPGKDSNNRKEKKKFNPCLLHDVDELAVHLQYRRRIGEFF